MKHRVWSVILAAGLMAAIAGCGSTVSPTTAPSFPTHPITAVIPYPPGGASDIITRIMDKYTVPVFGHHFVFRYDPGAGGALGTTEVAAAKPNGYTIEAFNFPQIDAMPLAGSGRFQPTSFDYIAQIVADPQAIATLKGSRYNSLAKLIAAARRHPGQITVAIPGAFDGTQFVLFELEHDAHVKFTMITYNGGGPEAAAILGKHVDAVMVNYTLVTQIQSKLDFLAVSTQKPFPALPGVPTFTQQGYPIVFHDGRIYIAPKGLPKAVLTKLRNGFKTIFNNPQFQATMKKDKLPLGYLSGSALNHYIQSYVPTIRTLMKDNGLLK